MQHRDRSHIIRNCGDGKFIKYQSSCKKRNVHTYTRDILHFTTLSDFKFYVIVHVYERNGLLYTDGCADNSPCNLDHDEHTHLPSYVRWQQTLGNIRRALQRWTEPKPLPTPSPTHFKVAKGLQDNDLQELL